MLKKDLSLAKYLYILFCLEIYKENQLFLIIKHFNGTKTNKR